MAVEQLTLSDGEMYWSASQSQILTGGDVRICDITPLTAEQKRFCLFDISDECTDIRTDLGTDQTSTTGNRGRPFL